MGYDRILTDMAQKNQVVENDDNIQKSLKKSDKDK
jgi:hypothetical protein